MFSLLSCLTMTNQAKKYTCISLLKKVEPQRTPIYYYLIAINSQWKVFHKVCIGKVFRTTETNAVLARIYLKWHHNSFFRYTWCILWPLHASSTYLKSLYLELKALEQWGWEQWKGFSPVWQNTWSRSLSCELKRAPHTKHSFPLPLPSRSLSFSFSVSLSVLPAAGPPNTLVAPRRSSSSSVSVAIWCEASVAAAAMAALGCRCHWNSAVAALPSRLWFDIAATFKGRRLQNCLLSVQHVTNKNINKHKQEKADYFF